MIDSAHGTGPLVHPDEQPDRDPLVAEVRAVRATIAREAGYDLARIVADLRRIENEERSSGRAIITSASAAPSPAA